MISNISFAGRHCLHDFACEFFENSRQMGPDTIRSAYQVAGRSGSILYPGREVYEDFSRSGELIQRGPQRLETEDLIWQQSVAAWLLCGKERLIFDRHPDRYYWAQVDKGLTFGYKAWMFGSIAVEFLVQPFAYALQRTTRSLTMTDKNAITRVPVDTGIRTPLDVTIVNSGTAALQGVTVVAGKRQIVLAGMNVVSGKSVVVNLSGERVEVKIGEEDARRYVQSLQLLQIDAATDVSVQLATGSGTISAHVTLSARGRWVYG